MMGKALADATESPDSAQVEAAAKPDKRDPKLETATKQNGGKKAEPATKEDRAQAAQKFGALAKEVSWARDKDGVYAYTHRARSKSYAEVGKMPMKDVRHIESTG